MLFIVEHCRNDVGRREEGEQMVRRRANRGRKERGRRANGERKERGRRAEGGHSRLSLVVWMVRSRQAFIRRLN